MEPNKPATLGEAFDMLGRQLNQTFGQLGAAMQPEKPKPKTAGMKELVLACVTIVVVVAICTAGAVLIWA